MQTIVVGSHRQKRRVQTQIHMDDRSIQKHLIQQTKVLQRTNCHGSVGAGTGEHVITSVHDQTRDHRSMQFKSSDQSTGIGQTHANGATFRSGQQQFLSLTERGAND
jgi:microcompartment protein CcmK/EutM